MSIDQSRAITRKSASNLALSFVLLPRHKRDDMSALYAFCREVDDVADEESRPVAERRESLARWREDVRRACTGAEPQIPVNRELQPVIRHYSLPFELFDELIKGVEMDLEQVRYESPQELERYCYRVASVVGLLSIEIFGYTSPACRKYAVALGQALQLTNILRDVRTDAERGRIYLPQSDLREYRVSPEEILSFKYSDRFERLARAVATRARGYYRQARELLPPQDRRSMIAAELMGAVYWQLLRRVEARHFDVLGPTPVRLSKAEKMALVLSTWIKFMAGFRQSAYGD